AFAPIPVLWSNATHAPSRRRSMATVIDRCFEFFRSVGMTTMFGNPGSTEELFLKDFPADFRYVLGLHEASVVNMAVGYALAGDRAALVNLHTAAGMGNAMARRSSTPTTPRPRWSSRPANSTGRWRC